jgi:hypothetical protein
MGNTGVEAETRDVDARAWDLLDESPGVQVFKFPVEVIEWALPSSLA